MLLVFDLDGTLLDSRLDLAESVNLMRASYQLPPLPLEKIVCCVGNGTAKLVSRSLEGEEINCNEAVGRMLDFYSERLMERSTLYPGVCEGLDYLWNKGHRLALFTNKIQHLSEKILVLAGIDQYFCEVIGAEGKFPLKPSPEALIYLANEYGNSVAGMMIGDHNTDLAAARMAMEQADVEFKKVYAAWGFGNPGAENYDFKAEKFKRLVEYVDAVG